MFLSSEKSTICHTGPQTKYFHALFTYSHAGGERQSRVTVNKPDVWILACVSGSRATGCSRVSHTTTPQHRCKTHTPPRQQLCMINQHIWLRCVFLSVGATTTLLLKLNRRLSLLGVSERRDCWHCCGKDKTGSFGFPETNIHQWTRRENLSSVDTNSKQSSKPSWEYADSFSLSWRHKWKQDWKTSRNILFYLLLLSFQEIGYLVADNTRQTRNFKLLAPVTTSAYQLKKS